jgi:hypothetical protein
VPVVVCGISLLLSPQISGFGITTIAPPARTTSPHHQHRHCKSATTTKNFNLNHNIAAAPKGQSQGKRKKSPTARIVVGIREGFSKAERAQTNAKCPRAAAKIVEW